MKAPFSIYCILLLACLAVPLQAQNTAPTDITLTPSSVREIANYNQTIGTLAAVDANTGDTHTFTLVSGTGSTDNATFAISGSSLRLNGGQVLDFETKSSYAIRVQADDGQGGVFSKALTVTVINRNESPTFLLGADQSVTNVYNTAQTVTGFATGIGDGDSTVTQTLTFTTTVLSGAEIFAVTPSVSLAGVLTYTPNGTSGTATIEVRLTDDATINGDAALSLAYTFTISSNYTAGAPSGGTVNLNTGGTVKSIGIQRDGAYVVGGTFTTALGTARSNLARLNANHTLDTSFDPKTNGEVTAVVVQPDGKILIGGAFTTLQPNGAATTTTRNRIARLNADGTLDASFNPNAGGAVNAISLLDDGRILIGGAFTTLQPPGSPTATTRNRIAMLNADGTLDTSFNPNANNTIHSIVQQGDGRLLIGGVFTTLQPPGAATATTRNRIARLNADGTLDTSFNPNAGGTVHVIAVQPDGKIVLGGAFTTLQPAGAATATTRNRIARLNTDGSLDTAFDPNASNSVFCIALQAGGGMMIGGDFTTVASTTRNRAASLTATGSLNTGFNPNASNTVHAMACLESSDLMLLGGLFTTLTPASTAVPRTGLALIYSPSGSGSTFGESSSSQITYTRGVSSTVVQSVSMELSTDGRATWAPLGPATRVAGTTDRWRITGLSLPVEFDVRVRSRAAGGLGNGSGSQIETVASLDLSTLPTIANPTLSQPTATSAIVGADVTSDGSTPILERGIVYALTLHASQPSLQTFRTGKITASGTTGPFNVTIPNLSRGSGYSFRAYVKNKNGTVYSSAVSTASSISATTIDRGTGGVTGQSPSLAVVNGCPAISYFDVTDGNLKYARNSAPDGTGTWSITTVFSDNASGFYSALAVINGYPAIAYSAGGTLVPTRTLEVHYIRANDVDGTSWGQPVKIETYGESVLQPSAGLAMNLMAVDGNPAIAYIGTDGDLFNTVNFWRAGDAVGSTWTRYGAFMVNVFPTIPSLSLAIVDGNPALCYNDSGLKYRRATNAQGTAWGTAVTVSAPAADGVYCSLQVINGNPAISHYNSSTRDLKYSRATNTTGTGTGAWSTSITLDSTGDVGSYTTLLMMDGKPAISYHDTTSTNLKLIRATTASGATTGEWAGAAVLDSIAGDLGKYARMAMVNGLPAIAYHDATGGDLKFIQATDAAGSAWAAPSVVDAGVESGDVGRSSSQCIVNGSPAIAYHDATNGSIRYVRANPLNNAWSVPIEVATGAATGLSNGAPSLWVVNGRPAITYANAVTGRIQYVRALDADGTSWGSPVDVTTSAYASNTFQATSLRVVAGRPCVIFQDYTTQQLVFVRAADMEGNVWNPAQVLAAISGTVGVGSLAEVNGRAAVTYAEPLGPLRYMRAADADATSWNAPVPISTLGQASSLAIVQGHPAISFRGSSGMSYVRADDVDGTIWPAPITINSVQPANTSLAVIDGQPAIAYCDNTNTSLYYTRAASATGSLAEDWSTPVNLSATKSILTLRRTAADDCSLIDFNGDAVISYYDSFEDNLVWVHYAVRFTVEQPVTTALVSGSTSRSLGNVSIGSSSSPLAFTLRNTGGVPLSFLAATKDGANPGDFTLDTSATAPLIEGGAAQTLRVTFTPSGSGVRTAVLHLLTDDPVTPSFDITLTGTGVSTGNAAPTDITLSSQFITENAPPGITVGTLAAVDADVGDTHVFTLVPGSGSADNSAFTIAGNQLYFGGTADYETKSSYAIRIRATDAASDWTEKNFTITVRRLFESWAILHSLPVDPTANAGENLKRFAFGLNPDGSSTGPITLSGSSVITTGPPRVESIKNGGTFSFNALYTRRKDWQQAGLTYTVRFSGDLANWVNATGTPSVIASDASTEAVVVRYPLFVNGLKARFFVVEVTLAP